MPNQVALVICVLFISWLFARDRRIRPMTSLALWIPLLWILVVSSRPISFWFSSGVLIESPDQYVEGSPIDAAGYFILMVIGFGVLLSRGVNWGKIFASNWWLFVFFLYCGLSVIWSDYPFVSFKRWFKDIGNVVMVLIILSEKDPILATRAMFARFTYLVVPLSVLLIKYYTDYGKYFSHSGETSYCGVTTEKNALGCLAMISGMFLVWDFIHTQLSTDKKPYRTDLLGRGILLVMVFWLMNKAQSSTALVCLLLGASIILVMQLPSARRQVRYLGTYALFIGLLIFLLYSAQQLSEAFVGMLGEDMTLTGRTLIWSQVLSEPINPFLGTGFQSFWMGPRAERIWKLWSFHANQAHNGYLETYLNVGLVGLFLLLATIVLCGRNLKKELLRENLFATLCLSFLFVNLFYNLTEAMFSKMSPMWFILLLCCLSMYPARSPRPMSERFVASRNDGHRRALLKPELKASL